MMASRTFSSPIPPPPPPDRRGTLAVLLVFIVGLAAAFGVARLIHQKDLEAQQSVFEQRTQSVKSALQQHMQMAMAILHGARRLAAASDASPGATAPRVLSQADLDRARSPIRELTYIDAGAALGTDAPHPSPAGNDPAGQPEPDLRAVMLRAADSGQITLYAGASSPGTGDASDNDLARLALYLPVYRGADRPPADAQQRRAATTGFLSAVLDPRRFVELVNQGAPRIDLRILAGTPPTVVFASDAGFGDSIAARSMLRRSDTLSIGGTPLTLDYATENRTGSIRTDVAATIALLAGVCATLIMTVMTHLLTTRRAVLPTPETGGPMNEARMMGIIRSSMEAIITIDESQTVVIFNPAAERVFGVSAMDAIGAPLTRFIPERFRAAHARHVEQFGVTGVSERQMGRQRVLFGLRANGEEFPIEASISQIRDGSGKLYTVMLRDVTERVRSEDALKQSREELRDLSANLQNVREEEKTRIARELHDDLGQQLTALKMDISMVAQALARFHGERPDAGPIAAAEDKLNGMRQLIDSAVASVRRIAADLRPVMLDDLGLAPAIEWLANDFTHRYGIDVVRDIDPGDGRFTSAGATTLFRIVQEALTNVARHAEATRVDLSLKIDGSFCVLHIIDNGRGLRDGATREEKSFGLIGIRERAHMLNGSVSIDSTPGHGFSITVALPLQTVQQGAMLP